MKANAQTGEFLRLVASTPLRELSDADLMKVFQDLGELTRVISHLNKTLVTEVNNEVAERQVGRELRAKPIAELEKLLESAKVEHERLMRPAEEYLEAMQNDSSLSSSQVRLGEAYVRDGVNRRSRAADISDRIELLERIIQEKQPPKQERINFSAC